jgi:hypothetical protein
MHGVRLPLQKAANIAISGSTVVNLVQLFKITFRNKVLKLSTLEVITLWFSRLL